MATQINPGNVQDWDEALNTDPMYSVVHVFSTDDITGTFGGLTQGDVTVEAPVIDFTADPTVTKDGVNLYPIDSEFGYDVSDFESATPIVRDGLYEEGYAGNVYLNDEQIGLVVSDAKTDTFKTPAVLGTWLSGLGGNTVKASTEHYSVMQAVLSDQVTPGDGALYPLDDELFVIGGDHDGKALQQAILDEGDSNGDGVADIKDVLAPNETQIDINIAASSDYSVTVKDDGKLLYRWGNTVKKPNDIRIEAELPLPDEWKEADVYSSLKSLYRVTQAELVVHHTITNNPNDQVRPEDFENESAIGTLPTYEEVTDYLGETGRTVWLSTDGYYAGDGTFYEAGTILKDSAIAAAWAGSTLDLVGAMSVDLQEGYTPAWYTTMNREPFEPVLNEDGTEYIVGPRWRLQTDKYGQDLPSVVMPIDPSATANPTKDQVKYEVGSETQTVLNLLDWEEPVSPLSISAGWQRTEGNVSASGGVVSIEGVNMTENFDVAIYIKGDIKPATIYSAELLMDYEELDMFAVGAAITGTTGSDYLVGLGSNSFTGDLGADLFVLSYGTSVTGDLTQSTIADFEVGVDTLGFIGLGVDGNNFAEIVSQEVDGDDLQVLIDGEVVAVLAGTALDMGVGAEVDAGEGLSIFDFLLTNPGEGVLGTEPEESIITGTSASETLTGTIGDDLISGLGGDDYLYGLAGEDTLDGGAGIDRMYAGAGDDVFVLSTGTGIDFVYDFTDGEDMIALEGVNTADFGSDVTISSYSSIGTMVTVGSDRMILRGVDIADIDQTDFIFEDSLSMAVV